MNQKFILKNKNIQYLKYYFFIKISFYDQPFFIFQAYDNITGLIASKMRSGSDHLLLYPKILIILNFYR